MHHNRFSHFLWSDTAVQARIINPCTVLSTKRVNDPRTCFSSACHKPLVSDYLIFFHYGVEVGLLKLGSILSNFRCTVARRFYPGFYERIDSFVFSLVSLQQGGLSLRPDFPCLQNSEFTGEIYWSNSLNLVFWRQRLLNCLCCSEIYGEKLSERLTPTFHSLAS